MPLYECHFSKSPGLGPESVAEGHKALRELLRSRSDGDYDTDDAKSLFFLPPAQLTVSHRRDTSL